MAKTSIPCDSFLGVPNLVQKTQKLQKPPRPPPLKYFDLPLEKLH